MIVGMWMTRNLVAIQPDTRLAEAAALMAENCIRRLPVVRKDGEDTYLLGLVSATDVFRALPAHCNPFAPLPIGVGTDVTASQIMTNPVLTTSADTPIEDAATVMRDRKIGALPVMREGRLIGLITESDIFRAFISVLKGEAVGVRVTFSVTNDEDVFALLADRTQHRRIRVQSLMSSRQDNQTACVAHISGPDIQETIDDLWKSGHQVLNVLHSV
jgi:acetoin utilization protein AcuB